MSLRSIRGPLKFNATALITTGNHTVVNASLVIINKTSGAPTTVTLPPSVSTPGTDGTRRVLYVFDGKGDAATNNITIAAAGADTVNGGASIVITKNYGMAMLLDLGGGAWVIDPAMEGGAGSFTSIAVNGVTIASTPAEIDAVAKVSTRLVTITSATAAITAAAHGGRVVLLDTTHTQTITLPQATGSGNVYTFVVKTLGTDGSKVVQVANATDVISGVAFVANTQNTTDNFLTSATSDTVTYNNTTQGGIVGARIEIIDIATGVFAVRSHTGTTGNPATPFSASV